MSHASFRRGFSLAVLLVLIAPRLLGQAAIGPGTAAPLWPTGGGGAPGFSIDLSTYFGAGGAYDGSTDCTPALTAAIAAIGATQTVLQISGQCALASSKTIPANIILTFVGAGEILPATTKVITILGPLIADAKVQIFGGAGTISFAGSFSQREFHPDWWGAVPDNGITNNYAALQATQVAASGIQGTIVLSAGNYVFNSSLNLLVNLTWVGQGKNFGTQLTPNNTAATVTGVAITGTAGQFSCTCTNLAVGQTMTISGTYGGTGSITGYANPTNYYISATNGTSTFTLQTLGQGAIVTTVGTPTGLTYAAGVQLTILGAKNGGFAYRIKLQDMAINCAQTSAASCINIDTAYNIELNNLHMYGVSTLAGNTIGVYMARCSQCVTWQNSFYQTGPHIGEAIYHDTGSNQNADYSPDFEGFAYGDYITGTSSVDVHSMYSEVGGCAYVNTSGANAGANFYGGFCEVPNTSFDGIYFDTAASNVNVYGLVCHLLSSAKCLHSFAVAGQNLNAYGMLAADITDNTGNSLSVHGSGLTQYGVVNLNASNNAATNIGTGTTTSTVTIGGGSNVVAINGTANTIAGATSNTITGVTNINVSNNAATNIGTGSTSSAVGIGGGSNTVNVNAATNINASNNQLTNIGTGTTTSTVAIGGGSNAITLNDTTLTQTGTTNINVSNNAATNIGTGSTVSAVGIGGGSNTVNMNAATNINASNNQATNIGTGTTNALVSIGGGSNAVTIAASAGNLTLANVTTGTNADFVCMAASNKVTLQTSACTISSLRYKENIEDVAGSVEPEIDGLRVASFNMKEREAPNPDPNFGTRQVGLIAENVAEVAPECAIYDDDMKTPKSYRQECVIALLVHAVQEQRREIQELKQQREAR